MFELTLWMLRLSGFMLGIWLSLVTETRYRLLYEKPTVSLRRWGIFASLCLVFTFTCTYMTRNLWPPEVDVFAFFAGGIILGIYRIDLLTRLIPDRLQIAGFVAGIGHLVGLVFLGESWNELLAGVAVALAIVALLWFLSFIYLRLRGHVGFGMGDIKFLAWLSLFFGKNILDILMIAVVVSLIEFMVRSARQTLRSRQWSLLKLDTTSPFGPSIIWGVVLERLLKWSALAIAAVFLSSFWTDQVTYAKANATKALCVDQKVDPSQLKSFVSSHFGKNLNVGNIRVGKQEGELLVLNLDQSNFKSALESLRQALPTTCFVSKSNQKMNSFMITASPQVDDSILTGTAPRAPLKNPSQMIRQDGYVIGLMQIPQSAPILLVYPSKLASEMAKGSLLELETEMPAAPQESLNLKKEYPSSALIFQPELDIEYTFGGIKIFVFTGIAKASLRESSDRVLGDLRRKGFGVLKGSEAAVERLEGFLTPDSHESYWYKNDSIVRVELEKKTRGRIRVQLHETRQIR